MLQSCRESKNMNESLNIHKIGFEADVKARAYWWFIEHGLRLNVVRREELEPVRRHMSMNGSLVVFFNHESLIDPGVAMSLMQKSLGSLIHRQMWLASSKFFPHLYEPFADEIQKTFALEIEAHKREAMQDEAQFMHAIAHMNRAEMLPVVQSHRIGDGAFKRLNVVEINLKSLDIFAEALRAGGTVGGISPEGTRSRDGLLAQAQAGMQHIFRDRDVAEKTMIVPLALTGTRDVHSVQYGWKSPLAPVTATFGSAFCYDDVLKDAKTYDLLAKDVFMLRVGRLLPPEKLGYYAQPQFSRYLSEGAR